MENFNARLQTLMDELRMSNRALAKELTRRGVEVSRAKVDAWTNGGRTPSLGEALELARIFGVSLEYLAAGEEAARHATITERERDVLKAAHVVGVDRALKRIMAADQPPAEESTSGGPWRVLGVTKLPEPAPARRRSRQPKSDHEGADRK